MTVRKWRSGAVTAVGATLSLALLTGVVTWSYRLGVRDAEDIPVIRAEAGLTRMRPEDPGGQVVAHQEREVYSVVSGNAASETIVEERLAPPPSGLDPTDQAPANIARRPEPRPAETVAPVQPEVEVETPPPAVQPDPPPAVQPDPSAEAPAATAEDPLAAAVAAAVAEVVAEETPQTGQAPRNSPVARARPSRTAAAGQAQERQSAPEPREAASASSVQIQLGAFDSEAIASREWERIKGRNGDLMTGRGRVISSVQSGGRTLWRLRAGPFDTVADAAALCRGLQARKEACIVARAR